MLAAFFARARSPSTPSTIDDAWISTPASMLRPMASSASAPSAIANAATETWFGVTGVWASTAAIGTEKRRFR